MKLQSIVTAVLIISACNNSQPKESTTAAETENNHTGNAASSNETSLSGTHCYLRTEGTSNQDSTKITLDIVGGIVTGTMVWLPAEKDSRKGTLNGTFKEGILQAKWTYMQEGMESSLAVQFKLDGNTLRQKKSKYDTRTGEEKLDDSSDYELIYHKTDCP